MTGDWESAPCGLLTLASDGLVLAANRTFLDWVGHTPEDVIGRRRLSDLLTVGGRIYWETHVALLLEVDGRLDEVAVELRGASARRQVLLTAVVDGEAKARVIQVALSGVQERARYERELVAARSAAERSAGALQALQTVTARLSGALGRPAVAEVVLDAACGVLGGVAATLWVGSPLALHGARGEDAPPVPRQLLDTAALVVDGRLVVSLPGQKGAQGLLSLRLPQDRLDAVPDLDLVQVIAQQAGLALERAQLYEQQAGVAATLQQALLGGAVPDHPRIALATAYRPGVEQLEVGGDWFDAFLVDEQTLAVSVGDVVGRGLHAASAMGQLRSAVRALAAPGAGPAAVLEGLDRFVEQVDGASMATLAYVELDLDSGLVRYACAGHPPPVHVGGLTGAQLIWEGRSAPLGAFGRPVHRDEAKVQLAPGDRIVLYTDGLVERRSRGLDVGLDLLVEAAQDLAGRRPDVAVADLVDRLLADEQMRDDVCVLLVLWAGDHLVRHVAELADLRAVRHDLRTWLETEQVPEPVVDDLVLACSEVLANALEHGGRDRPSIHVALDAELAATPSGLEVVIRVVDDGAWHEPERSSEERGRGLRIVGALVDDVVITREQGTDVTLRRRVAIP